MAELFVKIIPCCQAVAFGGKYIGIKGMIVAAKILAFTAIDLFTTPALIQKAKAAFI